MIEQSNIVDYDNPYKFNGKELDTETGLYYYGARYYDPKLSGWLSVDPMAEKYPSFSSYVFCANNPVMFIDPDGRDLDIALNEGSKKELKSIVSSKNRDRINFNDQGNVTVDLDGLSKRQLKRDKGLSLISQLVSADEKYLFEVGDVAYMKNEDGKNQAFLISITDPNGVMNASDRGRDSQGKNSLLPSEGYNGQVSMVASGHWEDLESTDLKRSVVFHELAENYFRTTKGYDYNDNSGLGAHSRAARWEGMRFNNSQPGAANYLRPNFDKSTRSMIFYITKLYNDAIK